MMTGTQNVNSLFCLYHITTLIILFLFAVYDFRHHKIRNVHLCAFLFWCLFSIPLTAFIKSDTLWHIIFFHNLSGAFCGFSTIFTAALLTHGGIGGGDIKLVALLGFLYGTNGLVIILLISCAAIFVHFGLYRLLGKKILFAIPFAPYLFAGCTFYVLPNLC